MTAAIVIACSVVGGVILLYGILRLTFAAVRRRLLKTIAERFSANEIIMSTANANYFGLESKGGRRLRGNCALVLTEDMLWSRLAASPRGLSIPVRNIRNVSFVKSHCGRSVFVDLLRVDFLADDAEDAAAWYVRDPARWKEAIEARQGSA